MEDHLGVFWQQIATSVGVPLDGISFIYDAFEHAQHLLRKIPGHPQLVRENQMTEFAEEVAEKISQHENGVVVREEPPKE